VKMDPQTSLQRVRDSIRPYEPDPVVFGKLYAQSYGLPAQENGILQYWPVLRKHRWTILATVVIVVTLTAIVSLRTTPIYVAVGRIAINREGNPLIGIKNANDASGDDDTDYSETLETQIKILQSDNIAMAVARALQLDKNPAFASKAKKDAADGSLLQAPTADPLQEAAMLGYVHGGLRITQIPKTRILEIRFTSPDPQMAARVVNTVMNVYIEQNFKTKFESAMQTSDWLSKQLADLQLKVETSQEKLVRYQKEHGILGLDEKQNIVTEKLDEMNKELISAEGDRIQKESRYRLSTSGSPDLLSNLDSTSLLPTLRAKQADLKTQIAQSEVQLGPAHPRFIELNRQLRQVDNSIQGEMDKLAGKLKSDYLAAAAREKMLREAMEQQKTEANKLNESAIEYTLIKRDVDSNRQLYEGLLQKLKEASVTAGLKTSNIRVVDMARVPLSPSAPDTHRNIMLALGIGLMGGLVLAFVLEALDNTVRTPEQAQAISAIPVLGIIPASSHVLPIRGKRMRTAELLEGAEKSLELVTYRKPKSEISESYRALRTSILLSSLGHPPKVILVTSALPQEGKTTTSVNTAVVLAQKGSRVLLVDGDLRRPSLHKLFHMRPKVGLSTVLTGSSTAEETITPAPNLPGLFLLPAGPAPPHPAELLGSTLMKELIVQWRSQYDHVIIDSPPALSVTDAVLLSVDVDSVLLVIRSGNTTKAALRRSRELLAQVNARVMGTVVNAVDVNSPDYYHYYYYGSKYGGYGRYQEETAAKES